MSFHDMVPIDTTRLTPAARKVLLAAMDRDSQRPAGTVERRQRRLPMMAERITVEIFHPGGTRPRYAVVPRNISTGGLSFVHGAFIYQGSSCVVYLDTICREQLVTPGRVVRCRYLYGRMHEVGVCFQQPVDLSRLPLRTAASGGEEESSIPLMQGEAVVINPYEPERKLQEHWLAKLGLTVVPLASEQEAMGVVTRQEADMVLVDMPDRSEAWALARKVRAAGSRIPLLLLTSEQGVELVTEAIGAGYNAVAHKPVTLSRLAIALEPLLTQPEPEVRSTLSADSGLQSAVEAFVQSAVTSAEALAAAAASQDLAAMKHIAQQLRIGSALGFDVVAVLANELLETLSQAEPSQAPSATARQLATLMTRLRT